MATSSLRVRLIPDLKSMSWEIVIRFDSQSIIKQERSIGAKLGRTQESGARGPKGMMS